MQTMGNTDLSGAAATVLAGRYRLLFPIGTGAGGRVWVGEDLELRRRVAVKVLHAALADDAAFLKRFRAEAQIAASLHHPNIVTVHDWGEDGVPFMVLELLTGGSLRAILDSGTRLTPSQAAYVGHRVATGLEYAHARGLVHRDIKPANLLFDEHGGVRIADFGLTRALKEASWTEPAGAMLGTARYAAPEQATGAALDGRADLYALGLVLLEAVTGDLPAAGDTALAVLAGRIGQSIVVPAELGELAPVVERAGRADPAERFDAAAEMADALAIAAQELPPPEPLELAGLPDGNGQGSRLDTHPTEVRVLDTVVVLDEGSDDAASERSERARSRGTSKVGRRLVPVVVALLVLAGLGGAAFALAQAAGAQVHAPVLVGTTTQRAGELAQREGLAVREVERVTSDDPVGVVVRQSPDPGSMLPEGGTIKLVVSKGPRPVPLPTVEGKTEEEARALLVGAGFELDDVRRVFDETVPKGTVISQDPRPPTAPGGSAIRLTVSDGPKPVPVPNGVGLTWEEAAALFQGGKLQPVRIDQFSDSVPKGKVISHDPIPGQEAPRDSKVKVFVSKGPDLIRVPDVRGKKVEVATQILEGLGFEVDIVGFKAGKLVRSQNPESGEQLRTGATITLYL